jgi:protein-S-isoprenylcysteine O-methyltransferase Ste14
MILLFVKLLLAHLIGDFILQPTSWVEDKEAKKFKSKYLYFHVLLHAVLIFILVGSVDFIWYGIAIALLHGVIDLMKLSFQKKKTKRNWFIADQILHLLVLSVITLLYYKNDFDFSDFPNSIWIVVTSVILLTKPTSIIIKNIISIWTPENKTNDDSLQNAGNYIGILERLFVFCFIITGHFEAIGFLLAAKSIFRFGDLKEAKDRKLTEYVLIGTLLSFGIAMLVGLLVNYAIVLSF